MHRTIALVSTPTAMLLAALLSACGGGGAGLTTASVLDNDRTIAATSEVGKIKNGDASARPVFVAWTAARAQRCGFYFDAAKLKTSYIAYEQTQGVSGPAVANLEKAYDTTHKSITGKISGDADYCSERKSAEIKTDLNRLIGGDYRPNFPEAKVAQVGAFEGLWSDPSNKKFESGEFWKNATENRSGGRRGP